MTAKESEIKIRRLEQLIEYFHEQKKKKLSAPPENFLRLFYQRVAAADLTEETLPNLYGAALSLWQFSERRNVGQPKVRVFNPSISQQGWASERTVIEIINDDMPFLVDSITSNLNLTGFAVHLIIHPIIRVKRDSQNRLTEVLCVDSKPPLGDEIIESHMHVEISAQSSQKILDEIASMLLAVLNDVSVAVGAWKPMLTKMHDALEQTKKHALNFPSEELDEARSFLGWLANHNFIFLGYREYNYLGSGKNTSLTPAEGSNLGILTNLDSDILAGENNRSGEFSKDLKAFLHSPEPILITKANIRSKIHRTVYMDHISIKIFDVNGKVIGEHCFVGLFTSSAYNQSPAHIPFLRRKVARVLELSSITPLSHDGKALTNIMETFPRDELFQTPEKELHDAAIGILEILERPRVSVFFRRDPFARFVSCLVYIPREQYTTDISLGAGNAIAEAFNGYVSASFTNISDMPLARVQYIIFTKDVKKPAPSRRNLEMTLALLIRTWSQDLCDELAAQYGDIEAGRLWNRYGGAFPASYADAFSKEEALFDIQKMEEVLGANPLGMNLYNHSNKQQDMVRLKLFHNKKPLPLSDTIPILENMGFQVIDEHPFKILPSESDEAIWIHDYGLKFVPSRNFNIDAVKENFHESLRHIWYGEVENDGFNRLVIQGNLSWREILILRAFCKYLLQAGITFSQTYMENALVQNVNIAQRLVEIFIARFDPAIQNRGQTQQTSLAQQLDTELEKVESLDDDRILRRFLNLVCSVIRTNYFQMAEDGNPKSYLSFKIDSRNVEELPLPLPLVETFIYSPLTEAIHLRGGKVARGGLRWSDRREDFRTEILGLMKAQMVKNALIVPVGAKGGFVAKCLPSRGGRDALQGEIIECYRILIEGLLDLVDNIVDGEIVSPEDVICYDKKDPYLVVAADKGTATFSDIANSIAVRRGFWLGDAFASGGSDGYDHKSMGITARGAWESVKRHFREMDFNTQEDDFTMVGVGDMSGDVFGNGALLSKHIKLVGAFNHQHIFMDPEPNPKKTWAERQRIFQMPRSMWSDFNEELISEGGGIFDRNLKSIRISKQAKNVFNIEKEFLTPNELIQSMLKSDVDLIWFGGIGTYVKAEMETNAAVDDRANDGVRIDAKALQARVVGEGANLGVTQLGRVEYALAGGRINTDAIDNSAGVDCSDHEVNIKILMDSLIVTGEINKEVRNNLLEDMTSNVAKLVLHDNYLQTQAITNARVSRPGKFEAQISFMLALERGGKLDRQLEFLPDDDALIERNVGSVGFSRPEVAVVLAYSKMFLYEGLIKTDVPADIYCSNELLAYFPPLIGEKFPHAIATHSLRKEIVATQLANSMVNRAGLTFATQVMEEAGVSLGDTARAYVTVRDALNLEILWAEVEALDNKVASEVQTELLVQIETLILHATLWFVKNIPQPMDISSIVKTYGSGISELSDCILAAIGDHEVVVLEQKITRYINRDVPPALASRVVSLSLIRSMNHIVHAASKSPRSIHQVAEIYFSLGAYLGLDWVRLAAGKIASNNHWERVAIEAIIEDLFCQQRVLAEAVINVFNDEAEQSSISIWAEGHATTVQRIKKLTNEFRTVGAIDLAQITILNRQLARLVASNIFRLEEPLG